MTISASKRLLTVAEYHKMAEVGILTDQDRVELINGEIFNMSPINSSHADCVDRLTQWFVMYFYQKAIVRIQNPITLNDHSEPEPDVLIAKLKDQGYKGGHPKAEEILLLVEVSDSSLEKDRQIKLPLYAKANIPEVWIVNLEETCIEIYSKPVNGSYTQQIIYKPQDTINTNLISNLKVAQILG